MQNFRALEAEMYHTEMYKRAKDHTEMYKLRLMKILYWIFSTWEH